MTLLKNITYCSSAKGLSILSQLFTLALLSRLLSNENLGLWFLFAHLIFFFSLFDLGLGGGALQNKLSFLHSQKETEEKQKKLFFSSFFLISFFYAFLFILLFFSSSFFLPILFPDISYIHLRKLFLLFSFILIIKIPFSIYGTALFAFEKSFLKSRLDLLENILLPLLLIFLYYTKSSLSTLIISYYTLSLVISLLGFYLLLKYKQWKFSFVPLPDLMSALKTNLPLSLSFWIQNLLSLFLFSSSPFFISSLFGVEATTTYCLCFKLCSLFIGIHFSFLLPLSSFYTRSFHQNDLLSLKKGFILSLVLSIFYFFLSALLLLFFYKPLVLLWTNKISNCNPYLLIWMISYGILSTLSILLNALNLIKKQLLFLCIGSLFMICMLSLFSNSINAVIITILIAQLPLLCSNTKEIYKLLNTAQNATI